MSLPHVLDMGPPLDSIRNFVELEYLLRAILFYLFNLTSIPNCVHGYIYGKYVTSKCDRIRENTHSAQIRFCSFQTS